MKRVLVVLTFALVVALPVPGATGTSGDQIRFGISVARQGLWAEARFRFEKALELDPSNVSALNNLAVACEHQGDFERARDAYEEALRLAPKNRHIQQNYELFREADDKRTRMAERREREASR